MSMLSKQERFTLFLTRLEQEPVVSSMEEALSLIEKILNAVEDEFSGAPYSPGEYLNDGRMYPPGEDAARGVPGRPDLIRYRSRGHNTWLSQSGAIRITTVRGGEIIFEKPGANGLDF